jgi:hypothetical protein
MARDLMSRGRRAGIGAVLALAAVGALCGSASAATPPFLWQVPEDGLEGEGAGQMSQVLGVASNSNNGHVLVADRQNARIDEFDIWGQFIKAWGWGVVDGSAEPQVCTAVSGCQAGIPGAGVGQLAEPNGIAVDASGNVYVNEVKNETSDFGELSFRVQKFDSNGNFVLMFGGEVNKTSGANLCTMADFEGGDVCGSGVPGAADGEFGQIGSLTPPGTRIAIGSEGKVFVGDVGRIEKFSPGGVFESSIEVPGETVKALALDGSGNFYVSYAKNVGEAKDNVHKLSPTGVLLGDFEVKDPWTLAVDSTNHLYVAENLHQGDEPPGYTVGEFDSSGKRLIVREDRFAEGHNLIGGLGLNLGCGLASENLYVSHLDAIQAYGPPPDPNLCPPPELAPSIADQYASAVDPDGAVLQAKINPHFWPDAVYFVEYGTGKCSEGGCTTLQPTGAPSHLTDQTVNAPVTTAGLFLPELEPDTTYHFRFVTESGGGGPVVGLGGEVGLDGAEGSFHTPAIPVSPSDLCPNAAFRTGFSADLPDCRAFEMVSPIDKEGGDIAALADAGLFQAAAEGSGLAYSSYRAFGDAQASPYTSQYIGTRTAAGWSSHNVSPPRGANLLDAGVTATSQYRLFSPDLCRAWLRNETTSILAPEAIGTFSTVYSRENCGSEADTYTAIAPLTNAQPKFRVPREFDPLVQGVSADGSHVVIRANDRLTDSGPDVGGEKPLVYEWFKGKLRMVCVLPNGTVVTTGCSAGSANGKASGFINSLTHAISDDGSRIFWSDSTNENGKLYVRIDGKNPTIQITTVKTQFWSAAADGSKAIYSTGDLTGAEADLFEYDVDQKTATPIAHDVAGLLGASDDANRIYLVSKEALAAGGEAGAPNLYLYEAGEGGTFAFIGQLSKGDAKLTGGTLPILAPVDPKPSHHLARVSADGEHAVFVSNSKVLSEAAAGYDNTDVGSGEPDGEVYRYDAQTHALNCVSCNPSNVRPAGRALGVVAGSPQPGEAVYWAAAMIRPFANELYASRVLSSDGSRVYFESFEALVPSDTNGYRDVYEWEVPGAGTCDEEDPSFNPTTGGCVSLISTGKSPSDTRFLDASADGSDVFIETGLSLLPQDPDLVDAYDARVGGGFPPPPQPRPPCEGEACQSPPGPPVDPTPGSMTIQGSGNVKGGGKKGCPKGRHKVHGKCKKVHRKDHHAPRSRHRRSGGGR